MFAPGLIELKPDSVTSTKTLKILPSSSLVPDMLPMCSFSILKPSLINFWKEETFSVIGLEDLRGKVIFTFPPVLLQRVEASVLVLS